MKTMLKNMGIISIELIEKGWSADKKYCITVDNGDKLFLRISPLEQYDSKKQDFEYMKQIAALGLPICEPVELGICDEGVYFVQSWIDGVDAKEIIGCLSDTEQYGYGFEAGRILKKIHSLSAPENLEDWETTYNKKLNRKIKSYLDCNLKYENGQLFVDFINENRQLLKDRPQVYLHGDYHIGNMMIGKDKQLYIIDFDRNDFGDSFEDMKAITWDVEVSPLFASGRINGYFDDKVPNDFWRLLALYISCGTLSSLPWAIPFGQGEIDTMRKLAAGVLYWYDSMKNPVPNWYL